MSDQNEQRKGRVRRWLDRRREGQRKAGEIAQRRKAARTGDFERTRRHGGVDTGAGDPSGPSVGL